MNIDNYITKRKMYNSSVIEPYIFDRSSITIVIRTLKNKNLQELKIRQRGETWDKFYNEIDVD